MPRLKCCSAQRTDLRAARANHVLCTDEKRIRTQNAVIDKTKGGLGWLLYKIVDGARMRFSSVRHRRSARTASRPRKIETLRHRERDLGRNARKWQNSNCATSGKASTAWK
jgi:hypothetical protein